MIRTRMTWHHVVIIALIAACIISLPVQGQSDDETMAWNAIASSQSAQDFNDFAETFPRGKFIKEARLKYSLLAQASLPPRTLEIRVNYPRDAAALPFTVGSRDVVLEIVVEADGRPSNVKVSRRSGYDPMDRSAVGAARRAVYLPAVENGVAIRANMTLRIDFTLRCPGEYNLVSCKDGEFR